MTRLVAALCLTQAVFALGVLALRAGGGMPGRSQRFSGQDTGAWVPGEPIRPWTHIIIHHSASASGSASHFDRAHRLKGWDGLGYHFVVGNGSLTEDGRVEAGERWMRQQDGAHAKPEWNARAIGVCLVGNFDEGKPSEEQLAALEDLCRWLCRECGIPPDRVVGHGETHGNATRCPGRLLDLGDLRRRLEGDR
ncbi:MAG: N-acetylmuramoyl-L-alanine amidase [Candidatus Brocadiae bacterium]|nr:N-acetylmuramoyl-L-alanine amidase [Candidatus Brocadiia bacterium]